MMKKDRNYFVVSVGKPESDYIEENLERIIKKRGFVVHEDAKQKGVFNEINKKDILILKYKGKFIAYGEVKNVEIGNGPEKWNHWAYVNEWFFHDKTNCRNGISKNGIDKNTVAGGKYGAVKKVKFDFAIRKIEEINSNTRLYFEIKESIRNMEKIKKYISLLEANKNIIFTGAPGTGKTYLAKQIALQFILSKNNEKDLTKEEQELFDRHYAFVQFHPSYDYTDFVEGLRPVRKKGNEIGFELKNGIFKAFCKRALENEDKSYPYVFIIDEINRAEISKVFGEIFFAIDPGYRGEIGKVKTQYANIQTEETYFINRKDDYFFVPKNVYIIGTMNEIDRSVDTFDFAMRRRFAWIKIKSDDRISILDQELSDNLREEAKTKMNNINKAIEQIEGLSDDYHIGPSYFLKLNMYEKSDDPFRELWDNHIEILLKEYLRGRFDINEKIDLLNKVFSK